MRRSKVYPRLHPNAPIIALDIDGTTGDYYSHFEWFANLYTQRKVQAIWTDEFNGEFSQALGLTKEEYRAIKLAYRQGGMKRCLPPLGDVKSLVTEIRSSGVQVWVCTTRPWNRLDNIDPDTTFWIERQMGRVDGVIYGEEKYEDLIDIVGKERILGVVDDLPENVEMANSLGLCTLLRDGEHNRWWEGDDQVRTRDTRGITEWARELIHNNNVQKGEK